MYLFIVLLIHLPKELAKRYDMGGFWGTIVTGAIGNVIPGIAYFESNKLKHRTRSNI
jgi:hypothetical protein